MPKKSKKWLAIVNMPLEIAITKLAGMDTAVCPYPEMKSDSVYETLYDALKQFLSFAKEQIKKNYRKYDCFYIHIKETDVPGHDGLPVHKKKMIEMIDEILFEFMRNELKNTVVVVTADHSTPCTLKVHSDDPVPLLVYGKGKDKVKRFDEKECRNGKLGKLYGKDMQNLLK